MKLGTWSLIVCAVLAVGFSNGFAADAKKPDGAAKKDDAKNKPINAKCPMQGEDIDPKVTTVYKGKTVAFCCEPCIDDFKKDAEKAMKQIAADNKMAADAKKKAAGDKGKPAAVVNKLCPVHPEDAVDSTVTTEYEGKKVGFCCVDCLKTFDADPKTYAARIKE